MEKTLNCAAGAGDSASLLDSGWDVEAAYYKNGHGRPAESACVYADNVLLFEDMKSMLNQTCCIARNPSKWFQPDLHLRALLY